jgi:hypothetical protein
VFGDGPIDLVLSWFTPGVASVLRAVDGGLDLSALVLHRRERSAVDGLAFDDAESHFEQIRFSQDPEVG